MILRGRRAAVETWLTIVLYGRLYSNLSFGEIRIFISSTNSTKYQVVWLVLPRIENFVLCCWKTYTSADSSQLNFACLGPTSLASHKLDSFPEPTNDIS